MSENIPPKRAKLNSNRSLSSSSDEYLGVGPSPAIDDQQLAGDPELHHLLLLYAETNDPSVVNATIKAIQRNSSAAKKQYPHHIFRHRLEYPISLAIELGAPFDLIHSLCQAFPKAIKMLHNDQTLLHHACKHQAPLCVVSMLLEQWPDSVKELDFNYRTPLHCACNRFASIEVVSLLLEKWPAATKKKDHCMMTPLHHACANCSSLEVVALLLESFPDAAKQRDDTGLTPLHFACRHLASSEVICLLLKRCPETAGILDHFKRTPLHYACRNHASFEIVSKLLEKSPSAVKRKDIDEKTPKQCFCDNINQLRQHDRDDHIVMILSSIDQLLNANEITQSGATHIVKDFIGINWSFGVLVAFKLRPSVIECFDDFPINVIPSLLSMLGHHCNIEIMWRMISNRQEIAHFS